MKRLAFLTFILFSFSCISQETIFFEDFQDGELPEDWVIINNDGYTVHPSVVDFSEAWVIVEDPDDEDNFVAGSTSYFVPVDRANRWLITAPIALGEDGNVFSWFAKSHDPSFPDSYRVMIAPNGGNEIDDFTDTLGIFSNESPFGIKRDFPIADYQNETVRFAFVNTTFNGFKLYVDSIEVTTKNPLSTVEEEKLNLSVFPNPTQGVLNLTIQNKASIEQIFVLDATGRELFSTHQNQLDISGYPDGIYFVRVQTTLGILTRKVIKR